MTIDDEKDYIMRIIKEMVRVLFSLLFGRRYSAVEVENVNKYEVEGKSLDELLDMADAGQINEAENILLDGIDYGNKENVAMAALFYRHLSEMDDSFLMDNNYSMVMRSIIKSRSLIFLGDKISTTRFLNIFVEEMISLKFFTVTFSEHDITHTR